MENFSRISLSIKVPKSLETGPGPLIMEQIFSTLSALQQESLSFEIIHHHRMIRFMVNCPKKFKGLVESQIYAHYPNAEIFEEDNYVKASPYAVSVTLKQRNPVIFPIKRYSQFEDRLAGVAVDPLSGITSALAKLQNPDDEAWIQFVISPLSEKWRQKYNKIIRVIKKGFFRNISGLQNIYIRLAGTRNPWLRLILSPLFILFWFQQELSGFQTEKPNDHLDANIFKAHDKESLLDACIDKVNKLLFEVDIRITYMPKDGNIEMAKAKVNEIAGSFQQFSSPSLNTFVQSKVNIGSTKFFKEIVQRKLSRSAMVLNVEELATLFHLPGGMVKTPNIDWVQSRKLEPPLNLPTLNSVSSDNLTLLGKTNYRGTHEVFGLKCDPDRRRHVYVIGKTGMGKTTLLENMIYSDIQAGRGVGVVDPHGDLADRVLDFIPPHRLNDVVLFNPSDVDFPVSFNMLENSNTEFNSVVASGIIGIFKKIYADSWGPRLEHILRNTVLSLLPYPDTTMLGIPRLLQDEKYRKRVVAKLRDPVLKVFWKEEFEKMSEKFRSEAISPILNKVGQFLSSPVIRNIVGQPQSSIDFRFAMDTGKIVIANLSKGKIGEDNAALLGAMLITKFQLDAMTRADIPEDARRDFYLYVDEFQNFATQSFATILSEARKYRLNLTMANQYIAQMPEEVRDAVFGNVGSLVTFQVGYDDADVLSKQFGEALLPADLVSLNKYTTYSRLLIEGMPSPVFSADTLPPPDGAVQSDSKKREMILRLSRERYATSRNKVEEKIDRWSNNLQPEIRPQRNLNQKPEEKNSSSELVGGWRF